MMAGRARTALMVGLALWFTGAGSTSVDAQYLSLQRIAFLPLVADTDVREVAATFEARLRSDLRLPPGKALLDHSQLEGLLADRDVRSILSSTGDMDRFASAAGVAFLVGGVLEVSASGEYAFSLLVFDEDTRQIASVTYFTFADDAALYRGAEEVQAILARSRTYASADSAFLLSILVPGLGQLQKDEPVHALVSAGLVGLSIIYAASTPDPDAYEFSREGFESPYNYIDDEFHHTIEGSPVTADVFYQTLDANWEHHLRAKAERRAIKIRRKRASAFLVGTYFLNVIDALVLAKEKTDTSPFFLSLEGISGRSGDVHSMGMSLQLRFSFR